jgi:curved DNA-binding protein CbpA
MDDFYKALEVERSATGDEIKANYRRLAMKWHPDRNSGSKEAEERFKAISEAYSVLSDPNQRSSYDSRLAAWESGAPDPGQAAYGNGYGNQYATAADFDAFFRGFAEAAQAAQAQQAARAREERRAAFMGAAGGAGGAGSEGFSSERAADMFMNEMYDLAIELTMQNVGWRDIASELIKRGCPDSAAKEIARKIEAHRKEMVRGTARPYFLRSALTGFFGLALVVIFGGAGLGLLGFFGLLMCLSSAYNLVRALYFITTGNAPKRSLI